MSAKYFIYIIIVFIILLFLDAMEIVDVPYLEAPDIFSDKGEMMQKTSDSLKDI